MCASQNWKEDGASRRGASPCGFLRLNYMLYLEGTSPLDSQSAALPPDFGKFQGLRWDVIFQAILDRLNSPASNAVLRACMAKMQAIPPGVGLSEPEMIAAWSRFIHLFPQHDHESALVYFRDLLRRSRKLRGGDRRQWYDVEREWKQIEAAQVKRAENTQGFPDRFGWSGKTYTVETKQGSGQVGYMPIPAPPGIPGGARPGVTPSPGLPPSAAQIQRPRGGGYVGTGPRKGMTDIDDPRYGVYDNSYEHCRPWIEKYGDPAIIAQIGWWAKYKGETCSRIMLRMKNDFEKRKGAAAVRAKENEYNNLIEKRATRNAFLIRDRHGIKRDGSVPPQTYSAVLKETKRAASVLGNALSTRQRSEYRQCYWNKTPQIVDCKPPIVHSKTAVTEHLLRLMLADHKKHIREGPPTPEPVPEPGPERYPPHKRMPMPTRQLPAAPGRDRTLPPPGQKEEADRQNQAKLDSMKQTMGQVAGQAFVQAQAEMRLMRPGTLSPSKYIKLEKKALFRIRKILESLPSESRRVYYNCTTNWDKLTQTYEADCDYRIASVQEFVAATTPYLQNAIQKSGIIKGKKGITGTNSAADALRNSARVGVGVAIGRLGVKKVKPFSIKSGMLRIRVSGDQLRSPQYEVAIAEGIGQGKRLYAKRVEYDPGGYMIGPGNAARHSESAWRERAVYEMRVKGYNLPTRDTAYMPSPPPKCRRLSRQKASNGRYYAICSEWEEPYKSNMCKNWYLSTEKDRHGHLIIKCSDWEKIAEPAPEPEIPDTPPAHKPPEPKPHPTPKPPEEKIPYATKLTPPVVSYPPGTTQRPRCGRWRITTETFAGRKFKVKRCIELMPPHKGAECVQMIWKWDMRNRCFREYCYLVKKPAKKPPKPGKPPPDEKPHIGPAPGPHVAPEPHKAILTPPTLRVPAGYVTAQPVTTKYGWQRKVGGDRRMIYTFKAFKWPWHTRHCLQTRLWYDPSIKGWREDCVLVGKPGKKPAKKPAQPHAPHLPAAPERPEQPPPAGAFKPRCISPGWSTISTPETGRIKVLTCFKFADGVMIDDCIKWELTQKPGSKIIRKDCVLAVRQPVKPPTPGKPPKPKPRPEPPKKPAAPKAPRAPRCKTWKTVVYNGITYKRCTKLYAPYTIDQCTRWSTTYDAVTKTQREICVEAQKGARGGRIPPMARCLKWQEIGYEKSTGLPIFKCVSYEGKQIKECVLWSKRPRRGARGDLVAYERYCVLWKPHQLR